MGKGEKRLVERDGGNYYFRSSVTNNILYERKRERERET